MDDNKEAALQEELKKQEDKENQSTDLGKVEMTETSGQRKVDQIDDTPVGFIPIDTENLPSQGLFYPPELKISIRSANAAEIRHWSSIDEENPLSLNEHLNQIISKCARLKSGKMAYSWSYLLEMDRLYLVLSIRDLTFKNKENSIQIPIENPESGETEKVELNNNNLTTTEFPDELMDFYNPENRSISFKVDGESIQIQPPTLGVGKKISKFIQEQNKNNAHIDRTFIQKYPFLDSDHTKMNIEYLKKKQSQSKSWGIDKTSAIDYFIGLIQDSVKPQIFHKFGSGEEVTVDIRFPNGVKSLFLISDITGKISKD